MCGIFGSIAFAPDESRIDIVSHRGPDGRGWREYTSPAGTVALGHRRLAIIDVSAAGLQPMADPSGRYHLVFNGELYNYLELREELQQRGEVFQTQTDSEVLLRAYATWGEPALHRFRGMFAFLIWDDVKKQLFAARDRFGIKPLYLLAGSTGVAFASEIKQLLGIVGSARHMNLARVRDFLAYGKGDHTAETMFEGIMQLRPGECATVDASRTGRIEVQPRHWYEIGNPNQFLEIAEDEAAECFRDLLTESVRIHLRSDVPLGSCLSGGLNSSSIVCLMAKLLEPQGGAGISTFSACYPEKEADERPFIEAVVAKTHAKPHYIFPRPEDLLSRASDITWHQDEPFGSSSIYAQWCVFEEAKRTGIKVMLDGQGADEQLAGYHFAFPYYLSALLRQGHLTMLARTLRERRTLHGASLRRQLAQLGAQFLPQPAQRFARWQRDVAARHRWLDSEIFGMTSMQSSAPEDAVQAPTDLASFCAAMTRSDNLQLLLHWEDRSSMGHSIEARVPFLDHTLVEFSLALGNNHKIVGAETKRVLRRAMSGIIPTMVHDRTDKLGFATPEARWFRTKLKGLIHEGIEATLARFPGLLNARGTRLLAADMLDGRRPVDFLLWRIVNLGIWGERFGIVIA